MSSRQREPVRSLMAHGQELRAIRQYLGWTQRQCAWHLAITPRSLSRYERGTHPVPLTIMRLARFYAMSAIPPMQFIPDRAMQTVTFHPGGGCLWRDASCAGPWYELHSQMARRRLLVTCACEAHLSRGYLALDAQLRAHEAREAHRQRRMATRRRARQTG